MAAPTTTTTAAAAAPAPTPTTAAPAGETTAAPAAGATAAPGQTTTAASGTPGNTTTAGGTGPSVTGKIGIDPDDGSPQSDTSIQVPVSAKLTLTWSGSNATSVNIDGVGDGQPISGSAPIPTQDGSVTLVAVADDGTKSAPVTIQISTHPDGEVVSGHSDISSGIAAVVSFAATKDAQTVTHASVGDAVVLTAIVSESTDQCTINGSPADLTDTSDGHKQATATVTIADGMSGDFTCEVSAQGTAGDPGSVHLDIGPAGASASTTTTAAPGLIGSTTTTASPGSTTTSPGGTTTQPGTTTTHPSTTTTLSPSTTTSQSPGTTTSHSPSTTTSHSPSTTTTSSDGALTNAVWGSDKLSHDQPITLTVTAPASAKGKTVYFIIEQSEDNGQTWTQLGAELSGPVGDDGTASVSTTIPDDEAGSGTGSAGADSSSTSSSGADSSAAGSSGADSAGADSSGGGHSHSYRFHASFTSSCSGGGQ